MLTFSQNLRPAYDQAWSNFVSNSTSTQYSKDDDAYHLKINLPGFRAEDINLSLENNILEVAIVDADSGDPAEIAATEHSAWRKRYRLPEDVDVTKIDAELKLGQLLITLNKKPQEKAIKIEVKS